jgi:hypothetical protein
MSATVAGTPAARPAVAAALRPVHLLLAAQSAVLVLASVNRLWDATDADGLPNGSLRVVDVLNLFVLAPASALILYLLLERVLADVPSRARRRLRLAFVGAVYLFALSYGMHEPADFVHAEFCGGANGGGALCDAVEYHDDELSHFVFFVGLAGMNAVLLLAQAASTGVGVAMARRDRTLVLANASIIALAIVANLGFEAIGLDLFVVAAVAGLAFWLLRGYGQRALIVYFAWAYGVGLAVTLAVRIAGASG